MVTRRQCLRPIFVLPLLDLTAALLPLAAASQFWDQKDPGSWTREEVNRLLTDSPWAQRAEMKFNHGPGIFGGVIGGGVTPISGGGTNRIEAGRGGGRQGANGGRGAGRAPGSEGATPAFEAVVRWESSAPIRAASKNAVQDATRFYILALVGNFPGSSEPLDSGAEASRQEMFQEFTKLERKGGHAILLDHIEQDPNGIAFFFPRRDPINEGNKEVTFTTKIGPVEIKAKFSLKEMKYRGKLDL
jgi:hypothetical protein